jgi:3-oxoacyl-[acyl-carrier protein] reductase
MDLKGKTAIVTGSGRGIGRAIAREFARQGANVVCCARREGDVKETLGLIHGEGGAGLAVKADVTDKFDVARLVSTAIETYGHVDVLFNNAASFKAYGALWEFDADAWWGDITTNVLGPMLCSRAVLPSMMERDSGVIINMNGGGAVVPLPGGSGYGSSKACLMRLTEAWAKELERAKSRVMILAIGPGFVHTDTTHLQTTDPLAVKWIPSSKQAIEAGETRPPEDCAKATVRMLQHLSPEMNGRIFEVDTDFERIAAESHRIKEQDLYVMRLKK